MQLAAARNGKCRVLRASRAASAPTVPCENEVLILQLFCLLAVESAANWFWLTGPQTGTAFVIVPPDPDPDPVLIALAS